MGCMSPFVGGPFWLVFNRKRGHQNKTDPKRTPNRNHKVVFQQKNSQFGFKGHQTKAPLLVLTDTIHLGSSLEPTSDSFEAAASASACGSESKRFGPSPEAARMLDTTPRSQERSRPPVFALRPKGQGRLFQASEKHHLFGSLPVGQKVSLLRVPLFLAGVTWKPRGKQQSILRGE